MPNNTPLSRESSNLLMAFLKYRLFLRKLKMFRPDSLDSNGINVYVSTGFIALLS